MIHNLHLVQRRLAHRSPPGIGWLLAASGLLLAAGAFVALLR